MRRVIAPTFPLRGMLLLLWATAATAGTGCYNGQEMVDRIIQRVADDHLTEVDLGAYQITLPRTSQDDVATTVQLEIVGAVERRNARTLERQLKQVEIQLRHATILALRESRRAELLEADLKSLRERVAAATVEYLTAAPLSSIAFRSFAVYED